MPWSEQPKENPFYSETAVARELDTLGANVLVLPKSVTLQDYYSADVHDEVIPEEYVLRLTMSDIQCIESVGRLLPQTVKPLSTGDGHPASPLTEMGHVLISPREAAIGRRIWGFSWRLTARQPIEL